MRYGRSQDDRRKGIKTLIVDFNARTGDLGGEESGKMRGRRGGEEIEGQESEQGG